VNNYTAQEWGHGYPTSSTDYDHQANLVTAGVCGGTDIQAVLAGIASRYTTIGVHTPARITFLGVSGVTSFYTASPYMMKIVQYRWRSRYDRNTATTTMWASAVADTESPDVSIPGVTPFQVPYWTSRFKCVGTTTKILGGTRSSGSHVVSFTDQVTKKFNCYTGSTVSGSVADPRFSSFVTSRACRFSTFQIIPERCYESASGTNGTGNSFYAPISFGLSYQYSAKWVPQTIAPSMDIATVETGATKPLLSARTLWTVDDNQHAVQQFSLLPL